MDNIKNDLYYIEKLRSDLSFIVAHAENLLRMKLRMQRRILTVRWKILIHILLITAKQNGEGL